MKTYQAGAANSMAQALKLKLNSPAPVEPPSQLKFDVPFPRARMALLAARLWNVGALATGDPTRKVLDAVENKPGVLCREVREARR